MRKNVFYFQFSASVDIIGEIIYVLFYKEQSVEIRDDINMEGLGYATICNLKCNTGSLFCLQ